MMRRFQENHLQHVVRGVRDDEEISRKSSSTCGSWGQASRKSSSTCVSWGQGGREGGDFKKIPRSGKQAKPTKPKHKPRKPV